MNQRQARPAVFLDRDGVLTEEVGHLRKVAQLRVLPGAAAAVRRLNRAGVPVVVVTNQSVVARGLCTEQDVRKVHAALAEMLAAEAAHLDGIYYCPHHPIVGIAPYRRACDCRKPAPGLLHRAARELKLDVSRSVMVGDKISDLQAGHAAGCSAAVLVLTGYGSSHRERLAAEGVDAAATTEDLAHAVEWIMTERDRRTP